jgi:hypothetical protein
MTWRVLAAFTVSAVAVATGVGEAQIVSSSDRHGDVPRLPDGAPILGSVGETIGYWDAGFSGALAESEAEYNGFFLANPADLDRVAPFKPWARSLILYRQRSYSKDDPHARCAGNGGPRQFQTPYGIDIVQAPHSNRILILSGWGRRWREIFMDGRPHPDLHSYTPTYYGHSVGHWEGDVLVVDSVGFNERFWFANKPAGMVHTDALHLVEKISRPTIDRLRYEVTIDDHKAYHRPWTASWTLQWVQGEMKEYLCEDNNLDIEHLVGPDNRPGF